MPATPSSARILIVRLSSLGDVIHAMPAVAALRQAHPKSHIAWAVEPEWARLFFGDGKLPMVDSLHVVPFRKWSRSLASPATWRQMRKSRRELVASHYDIVVDMQGSLRSAITARWTGAHRILGEADPRERIARRLTREHVACTGSHIIEQDLELASAIFGDKLAYTPPVFPRDAAAERWVDATLSQHSAARHALLLPGAGWGSKRWPTVRYGEVARGLRDHGFHCWLNVGPGEGLLANAASQASGGAATPLATTLPQLIALLRRTSLCIGGDTGPLHLACAMQVPVVGIYGPTDPARNGPFGSPFRVLRHPQSQRDHARRSQPEAGLLTITVQDVLHAVHDLMAEVKT